MPSTPVGGLSAARGEPAKPPAHEGSFMKHSRCAHPDEARWSPCARPELPPPVERALPPGSLLRDYHTAQVPSASDMKKRPHRTRRDELLIPRHDLNTVLSSREYRCDALYTVALWALPDAPYSLAALAAALTKPQFTLYLGRKSCPLALPVQAQVVTADHLAAALTQVSFHDEAIPTDKLKRDSSPTLHWEEGIEEHGLTAPLTVTRRDQPLSRRRWQFRERRERRGYTEAPQLPEG